MPKTITLGNDNDGINITWTPSAQRLDVDGYYDSFVGIQGKSFTLAEFFKELGITEKDVRKAFKEVANDVTNG
jgi:hypothetical protein